MPLDAKGVLVLLQVVMQSQRQGKCVDGEKVAWKTKHMLSTTYRKKTIPFQTHYESERTDFDQFLTVWMLNRNLPSKCNA